MTILDGLPTVEDIDKPPEDWIEVTMPEFLLLLHGGKISRGRTNISIKDGPFKVEEKDES